MEDSSEGSESELAYYPTNLLHAIPDGHVVTNLKFIGDRDASFWVETREEALDYATDLLPGTVLKQE